MEERRTERFLERQNHETSSSFSDDVYRILYLILKSINYIHVYIYNIHIYI